MAAYLFPKPTSSAFRIDRVAMELLPKEASSSVPVKVLGDVNCLFWAASFIAHVNEDQHNQLRVVVIAKIDDNVAHYADLVTSHAREVINYGDSDVSLLSQAKADVFRSTKELN